ncbi:D-sedoheptulose-7-phosphate isomerase [Deinococcus yavapaiensis]|uniref:D-sedoheptulose 7-phosphate isomerase n=1 Tax=Deinococcus yavapaiensis KR-236 TaxID=694435 RepID=A0A318S3A9_9DEIO|nr:SIS domain-containing protein [Deinococcus yavapaiensis]PYE51915.1 D-sedoheptulose 7-phosphate isomerase [Deinococcus yavapaiensis KR-236]
MSIHAYLETVRQALASTNVDALEAVTSLLHDAYRAGTTVYTCGNGASAALASHMACDLGKGTASDLSRGPQQRAERRLRVVCLNDNTALMTALANDLAYEDVYLEQLKNVLMPGDLVIGISGSGGSPNVLRALEYARLHGARTVGFTGRQAKCELIRPLCDVLAQAPLEMMEQIEDAHVIYFHAVAVALRERLRAALQDA